MNYILIDSQRLTSLQNCPQKFEYQYEMNKRSVSAKEYFDAGTIIHAMMRVYYISLKYRDRWHLTDYTYAKMVDVCCFIGEHVALRLIIDAEMIMFLTQSFRDYAEYYRNDPALRNDILGCEIYFAKHLGEPFEFNGNEYQVVAEGRIDKMEIQDGILLVTDHKTESAKRPFSPIRNQFLLYPLATGARLLQVNVFGLQKTKSADERFYRKTFSYPDNVVEEFENDVIHFAKQYLKYKHEGYFPRHHSACDTYGICDFERICYASIDRREDILEREYKTFKWDVFEG